MTSAFASSTAILTAIIPIAVPLLLSSHLSAAGLVAALAISTTIVDVSPFSTNCAIVGLGPALAWGVLVLPGAF
ncbi:hypothetical protein [Amycolatopsis sp. YIM 10]|uniref:hypothetical protein n=1 Tax=Amycolatopsis sp. YIM 10 TaxID=2653857 RepID=UPI0021062CA9|nr:hypothetical protein [Amycolatopsis sp. YIM 10]